MANGHILENLVNVSRLHKLDESERRSCIGDFWDASGRLKRWDQCAKDQRQLHDLDVNLREATIANLEAQRRKEPAPLTEIAKISSQKRQLERQLESEKLNPFCPCRRRFHGMPPTASAISLPLPRSLKDYFCFCLVILIAGLGCNVSFGGEG